MKRNICIILLLCVVVLMTSCSGKSNDIAMYAKQVASDSVLSSTHAMTVTVKNTGKTDDGLMTYSCSIDFRDIKPFSDAVLNCVKDPNGSEEAFYFAGSALPAQGDGFLSIEMFMDSAMRSCYIRSTDGAIVYVASVDENFDPQAVLATFTEQQ